MVNKVAKSVEIDKDEIGNEGRSVESAISLKYQKIMSHPGPFWIFHMSCRYRYCVCVTLQVPTTNYSYKIRDHLQWPNHKLTSYHITRRVS